MCHDSVYIHLSCVFACCQWRCCRRAFTDWEGDPVPKTTRRFCSKQFPNINATSSWNLPYISKYGSKVNSNYAANVKCIFYISIVYNYTVSHGKFHHVIDTQSFAHFFSTARRWWRLPAPRRKPTHGPPPQQTGATASYGALPGKAPIRETWNCRGGTLEESLRECWGNHY